MKLTKIGKFLALAGLCCAALASNANASLLVRDFFSYPNGNLVGNDPPFGGVWAAHSGAGSSPVQVNSGQITLAQGAGSREDVNVPLEGGAIGAGDVIYTGFDLTVPDPGAAVVETMFAHTLVGTNVFSNRLYISPPTTSGFRLALSNDSSATDSDGEVRTTDLAFDTTYRVVTKYVFDAKQATIWVNPVNESSPSLTATDPGFSDAVVAWAFRQAAGSTMQIIDNLRVADNFGGAIPEPASIALVSLAMLGVVGIRRRHIG